MPTYEFLGAGVSKKKSVILKVLCKITLVRLTCDQGKRMSGGLRF